MPAQTGRWQLLLEKCKRHGLTPVIVTQKAAFYFDSDYFIVISATFEALVYSNFTPPCR